jgi:hypothetical protein
MQRNGREFKSARFCPLFDTWRQNAPEKPAMVAKARLTAYLPPVALAGPEMDYCAKEQKKETANSKVQPAERSDPHPLLPFHVAGEGFDP